MRQQPQTYYSQTLSNLTQWLAQSKYKSTPILKYSPTKLTWQVCSLLSSPLSPSSSQFQLQYCHTLSNFNTLAFNVLTDCIWQAPLKRNILHSPQRYQYILKQLQKLKVDVITLNQVTRNFYDLLIEQQWVRKYYWVSQFKANQSQGSFNVLLAKIKPVYFRTIQVQNLGRNVLTAYFYIKPLKNKPILLSVSSTHLTSQQKNIQLRKQQLIDLLLKHLMTPSINKINSNNKKDMNINVDINVDIQLVHIIQGDLNIHQQNQTILFQKLGLVDSWLQYHNEIINGKVNSNSENDKSGYGYQTMEDILEKYPGYTFDGDKNSLIKQVYWGWQARRMRLDRILYGQIPSINKNQTQKNKVLKCEKIQIILDNPINTIQNQHQQQQQQQQYPRMGFIKGSISLLGDIVGVNIFRDKNKYLFPSDHFGLMAKFTLWPDL